MRSKVYQKTKAAAPAEAVDISAAVAFLKEHARTSFDETVELHARLGVDASKSDQAVRGTLTLPAGPPKQQRIVVFTDQPEQQQAALSAGATQAGGEEIIEAIIKQGSLDADVTIATPAMMPRLAKAARILGPKGLMPNPKTGTVSEDPLNVMEQLRGGQVAFKMDQTGSLHVAIAKLSWEAEKIVANATAALKAIRDSRPSSAKGEFLRSVTLTSTMGPGVRVM
ncbi:MAG TPA: 50S ribosomal protein L1 [Candidatus Andersenbacteria bacterium]|nr:50S ribosomal protein L1 [Candidatus Andersenbacteria bacterium]